MKARRCKRKLKPVFLCLGSLSLFLSTSGKWAGRKYISYPCGFRNSRKEGNGRNKKLRNELRRKERIGGTIKTGWKERRRTSPGKRWVHGLLTCWGISTRSFGRIHFVTLPLLGALQSWAQCGHVTHWQNRKRERAQQKDGHTAKTRQRESKGKPW